MNIYVLSLLFVPAVFALLFLLSNNKTYYKVLSYLLCIFGITVSILLAVHGPKTISITSANAGIIEAIITALEAAIIIFIFYMAAKHKRWHVFFITIIQAGLYIYTVYRMLTSSSIEETSLNITSLSIIMLLIVNIIGTLIVVFANGYITKYEHHRGMKSRQKLFYFVICIFLSAMNGLVMSDALGWIYFFWEITTLSSFILISYNKDEEGWNSGFRALFLNVVGGICFSIGNIILSQGYDVTTLTGIVSHGKAAGFYVVPIFLLVIAGFSKSAQMPFQSWLLGAMVAPTPVSALLHSSTMVKAGVYLIIKLSPAYAGTSLGTAIAIFGGFSFLITSALAVTQHNAKRVLAYSTIANLGLIICSAGIGSPLAITAAIILLVYHALSKALLFLCTGQIEHTIGSRDIEDMPGLIKIAPLLTVITAFGLVSMILPPFGVLVTKLMSIEAAAINPFVTIFIILGSSLTTLYYIKWISTILSKKTFKDFKKEKAGFSVFAPLSILSILILAVSTLIGPLYNHMVKPEIINLLGKSAKGLAIANANVQMKGIGEFNNEIIFIIIGCLIIVSLIFSSLLAKKPEMKNIYMCGENNVKDDPFAFRSANAVTTESSTGNLYLIRVINEKILTTVGYVISIALLLIIMLGGLV